MPSLGTPRRTTLSSAVWNESAKRRASSDHRRRNLCPGIPWSQIRGVGNGLRHEYDRINEPRIWLMVERDLAPLKGAVQTALSRSEERRVGKECRSPRSAYH